MLDQPGRARTGRPAAPARPAAPEGKPGSAPRNPTYAEHVLVNVAGRLRGHPRLGDVLLAAVLLGFSVPEIAFGAAGCP